MRNAQLIREGIVVFGVLSIWVAIYCLSNPPTKAERLSAALWHSLGDRQ